MDGNGGKSRDSQYGDIDRTMTSGDVSSGKCRSPANGAVDESLVNEKGKRDGIRGVTDCGGAGCDTDGGSGDNGGSGDDTGGNRDTGGGGDDTGRSGDTDGGGKNGAENGIKVKGSEDELKPFLDDNNTDGEENDEKGDADDGGDDDDDVVVLGARASHGTISDSSNPNAGVTDRGYAWVIVAAVFLLHSLMIGYLRSGGVMFVEYQRKFHSNASMTSLVIGLADGIFSISAPLVMGILVKHLSIRQICMLGSAVFALGVCGNALCGRIEYLILTHSLGFGLAKALIMGPSFIIINDYFIRRRALATTIATTGSSVGGIVFPLLARLFFDTYGFVGGVLLAGGVVMHAWIGSTLLTPFSHLMTTSTRGTDSAVDDGDYDDVDDDDGEKETVKLITDETGPRYRPTVLKSSHEKLNSNCAESETIISKYVVDNHMSNFPEDLKNKLECISHSPSNCFTFEIECQDIITAPVSDDAAYSGGNGNFKSGKENCRGNADKDKHQLLLPHNNQNTPRHNSQPLASYPDSNDTADKPHPPHGDPPNSDYTKTPSFPNGSLSKLSISRSILFHSTSTLNNTMADILSIDKELQRQYKNKPQSQRELNQKVSTFRKMGPRLSQNPLLKSASFWALIPFFFAGQVGSGMPQIFFMPLAKERGLTDDQAALCLSVMNVMDIIAHIAPGIILNSGTVKSTTVSVIPMAIMGIVGMLTPFFHSFQSLMTMAVIYGLCIGFFYALQSLFVIDTLGIHNYSSSMGFYYLTMGVGGAASFPIAGALRDLTGTYSTTFFYLASMELLAVFILLILPRVKAYDVRRGLLQHRGTGR